MGLTLALFFVHFEWPVRLDGMCFCSTRNFVLHVAEFVRNLIRKKKLTDAVRLICAFKLTNKFSPLPLITKYVNELKEYTKTNCKGKKPIEEKVIKALIC